VIDVEQTGDIAVLLLAEPKIHNAMGVTWPADLEGALEKAVAMRPGAIVVRGQGRSFCSGVNTRDFGAGRLGSNWFRAADHALLALDQAPVPTIAAIHGYCLGGGLQIASACDIRIAADTATLGLPAQSEGLIPGMSFFRLSRLVGASWAADLILTGRRLSASEALAAGLVTRVAGQDTLDAEIDRLTVEITPAPASTRTLSKQLLAAARLDQYQHFEHSLHDAMQQILSERTPAE
jgi:enoyl-CoA hydratase